MRFTDEYLRLRPIVRDVRQRVKMAHVNVKFEELAQLGVVFLDVQPDIGDNERLMLVSKYRCATCGMWHISQMIGGFVKEDEFADTRNEFDAKLQAIIDFTFDAVTTPSN